MSSSAFIGISVEPYVGIEHQARIHPALNSCEFTRNSYASRFQETYVSCSCRVTTISIPISECLVDERVSDLLVVGPQGHPLCMVHTLIV